ncbi:gluconeogenesis factor YvcK family protein [Corynebacterium camporealensis]
MNKPQHMACLGGGHGLYQTLLAARQCEPEDISAIVTVADDGGSSGRLRRELDIIPPGDLRMALAALSRDDADGDLWAATLQHRFGGTGAMAGHALGNLLIVALTEILESPQEALDTIARLTRSYGRVLPAANQALDIEAEVAGLDEDPRVMRPVRGQVAVASTPGQVRRVRLIPDKPDANPEAIAALEKADIITIGPGSWFSSVLPHVLVPQVVDAINESDALCVVVLNLTAEPGETPGFSAERHVHVLAQHAPGLKVDYILVDSDTLPEGSERQYLQRAADSLGAQLVFSRVAMCDGQGGTLEKHDPDKLSQVFLDIYSEFHATDSAR